MQEITVTELKRRIDEGATLHIVDVREPQEYTEYNIGGILVPLGQIMHMETDAIDHLKGEELIVHCRSGKRSLQACLFLKTMGFANVRNLTGGVLAWQEQCDPTAAKI